MSRKSRNRQRQRRKAEKKAAALLPEREDVKEELDVSVESEKDILSFEELEKADEIEDLVLDAEFLMKNIAGSELPLEVKEKSLVSLATSFLSRLGISEGDEVKSEDNEVKDEDNEVIDIEYAKMLLEVSKGNVLEQMAEKVRSYDEGKFPLGSKQDIRYTLRKHIELIEGGENEYLKDLDMIFETAKEFGIGVPTREDENSLFVTKDNTGDWRWFGVVSNNFKDRDGEIISEEAHLDFVKSLDENPKLAPEFWSWHTPKTARKERADWWSYENGFLMMSGKLDEKEALSLIKVASNTKLGMSHGFFARKEGNVITKYRSYEVSDLPVEVAANQWTTLEAVGIKETNMSKKLDYLTELFGADFASEVAKITEETQEELRDNDIEEKEVKEEEEKVEEKEEKDEEEEEKEVEISEEEIEVLAKALGLDELSKEFEKISAALEIIPALVGRVDDVEKSEDEKIAEKVLPPVAKARFAWQKRLSESEDTIADDDDEITKDAPEAEGWFSEAVRGESQ